MDNFDFNAYEDEFEEPDIETLEKNLEAANTHVNGLKESYTEDDENLTKLDILMKEQLAAYNETRRKIAEIEAARGAQRRAIQDAERELNRAKLQFEEHRKVQLLEQSKQESFNKMIAHLKEKNAPYVEYAYDYQWEGALTLAHYGSALLGDEAGLGKSMTSLMYADVVNCGHPQLGAKKVLYFVPADIVSTLTTEVQTWAPHRNVLPLEGPNPTMRKMVKEIIENSPEITVVVNYEAAWRDNSWLDVEWDLVVVDEAHNMKNVTGLTFDRISSLRSKYFLPMTGTPILNEPKDLFSSLHLIDPETFNDSYDFLYAYCQQNDKNKWEFRPGGEARMMRALKGRIVKRTFADTGIVLPKQHVREYMINPIIISEQQALIMKQLKEFAGIALETGESININAMIAVITRERQAAVYPAGIVVKMTESLHKQYEEMGHPLIPNVGDILFQVPEDTPSIKLDIAVERLKAVILSGKRAVVFSQFKTALAALEKRLSSAGISVARYDGDTTKSDRLAIKKDFLRPKGGKKKSGEYKFDVVLANYKTGGVGLTFTEATYMLCLDEEWNPAKNHQAWARICRIGQTEETLVEILRIDKSIDMWMKTLNDHKQAVVDGFEQEVNLVESFKKYIDTDMIQYKDQQESFDEDFLNIINGMELD